MILHGRTVEVMKFKRAESTDGAEKKDVKVFVHKTDSSETVERQVKFSDFRTVGGLLLPYKWTQTVGGNAGETVDITITKSTRQTSRINFKIKRFSSELKNRNKC